MASPIADTYSSTSGVVLQGGRGTPVTASLTLAGPSSGLERATSTPFTISFSGVLSAAVLLTFSDGASGKFFSLSGGDAANTVTVSPSSPTARMIYMPASSGVKTITTSNNGGLANPALKAYAATVAVGSATPFRLVRNGTTIGTYARLQQCRDAGWLSGDVVKVAGGVYAVGDDRYDAGAMTVKAQAGGIEIGVDINTLTIEAEEFSNPPFIDSSLWCAVGIRSGGQPQGLTAGIACHNLTVRGIRMRGSPAPYGSTNITAGFWTLTDYPATNGAPAVFTFDRCLFAGWGDGIKTRTHFGISVYAYSCVFVDNSDGAAGLHHDIYTGNNALTHVEGCTFIRTGTVGYTQDSYGHFVKSRCRSTIVRANRFYAFMDADYFGGANSLVNTPCGGVVEVTGNVLVDYGAKGSNSAHNILRSAEQQFPTSGEPSDDPLLATHSYLIAQNTMVQRRGYPLGDGNSVAVLKLYHIPSNTANGTVVATGVPTYAMTGSGTMVPVTTTVRNNIVANYDSAQAAAFLVSYPNNTLASIGDVSDLGIYSGGTVTGNPAVNDAALQWAGEFMPPTVRTNTNQGAYA